jgi:hypothetical protein
MAGRSSFVGRIANLCAVGIDPLDLEPLSEAWRNYGIQVKVVPYDGIASSKEQINAFIVRLDHSARGVLQRIRGDERHHQTLIYALGDESDVMTLAEFEISVLMPDLTEESAIEAIQNTYQLLLNQMRKYARIPMVIPVKVVAGAFAMNAVSRNISAGGIRLSLVEPEDAELVALQPDTVSQVSFEAPNAARFHLPSTLIRKSKHSIGFQFVSSPDKEELKTWLDKYLQK